MTGCTYDDDSSPIPCDVIDGQRYLPPQAKQRASVLWLLSKACDSEVPADLREPYYSDRDGEDRLKPQIVQALATAELYCLALSNIYADPNYNNLSHTGIIGVLMRKGIYVQEPQDTALTESILIRTNPIKMVCSCTSIAFTLLSMHVVHESRLPKCRLFVYSPSRLFMLPPLVSHVYGPDSPNDTITDRNRVRIW